MVSNKKKILLYMAGKEAGKEECSVDEIRKATEVRGDFMGVYLYSLKRYGFVESSKYGIYKITDKGLQLASKVKEKLEKQKSISTLIDELPLPQPEVERKPRNKKSVDLKDLKLIALLKEKYGKNQLLEIIEYTKN
jgi:Mn-dependent DtxR family transcriptional regulator